jgi:hypothetical protein
MDKGKLYVKYQISWKLRPFLENTNKKDRLDSTGISETDGEVKDTLNFLPEQMRQLYHQKK